MSKHKNRTSLKVDLDKFYGDPDERLRFALEKLSSEVKNARLMDEINRRRYYQKPSEVRKRKRQMAVKTRSIDLNRRKKAEAENLWRSVVK